MLSGPSRLALIAILSLTSCDQAVWVKSGATKADFEIAKGRCLSSAYSQVPQAPVPIVLGGGYTTPMFTSCSGGSYAANCITTGGQYTPPTTIMMDANRGVRREVFNGCMYQDGWGLQSREAAASQPPRPIKKPTAEAKKQAAEYCKNIFDLEHNVGMMAVFGNSVNECIAKHEQ